ncbi:hypothetical protein CRI94_00875 [Longibacter salinarum]|uniref:Glycerophosphoryl diester phosphodiesterase membrane domain-containing protein n=1 Tax=Longibacter salinarum TaxID=1850348 RepID=A0A2A8D1X0_9BACT|nr:hypothetical protein [Longibacter salinarum]PEN14880.1 hypothetical protein CRI94_00875 [Longibacter salinarum]
MSSYQIELRKERTLSDVINATFQFIRANIRILGKTILLIVGPLAAVVLSVGLTLTSTVDFRAFLESDNPFASGGFGALIGGFSVVIIATSIGAFMLMVATMSVVKLYDERGPGAFVLDDVWVEMKKHAAGLFFVGFLFFLAVVLPYPLAIIPCLGPIAYMAWAFYAQTAFTLAYPIRVFEQETGWSAFQRARELMKDHFWESFGVFFAANLMAQLLGFAAAIPSAVISFLGTFLAWNNPGDGGMVGVVLAVFYASAILLTIGLSIIMYIAMTLQYFNLVEQKENVGLRRRVEEMADQLDGAGEARAPQESNGSTFSQEDESEWAEADDDARWGGSHPPDQKPSDESDDDRWKPPVRDE